MTASPAEDQAAAAAPRPQVKPPRPDTRPTPKQQHQASGSTVVVEQASTPDDIAVSWTDADTTARPTLNPSSPPPVGEYETTAADPA